MAVREQDLIVQWNSFPSKKKPLLIWRVDNQMSDVPFLWLKNRIQLLSRIYFEKLLLPITEEFNFSPGDISGRSTKTSTEEFNFSPVYISERNTFWLLQKNSIFSRIYFRLLSDTKCTTYLCYWPSFEQSTFRANFHINLKKQNIFPNANRLCIYILTLRELLSTYYIIRFIV